MVVTMLRLLFFSGALLHAHKLPAAITAATKVAKNLFTILPPENEKVLDKNGSLQRDQMLSCTLSETGVSLCVLQ